VDGLVHISQLSDRRVEVTEDIVRPGQKVWVKLIEIKEERGQKKLSLSMKTVAQVNGTDMDPDNAEIPQKRGMMKGGKGGGQDAPLSNSFPDLFSIHQGTVQSIQVTETQQARNKHPPTVRVHNVS
jgi:transcriptional accessory protein Tex/SPT6